MSETERKKGFSTIEKELFLNIIQIRENNLTSKQTTATSALRKKQSWEMITEEFNEASVVTHKRDTHDHLDDLFEAYDIFCTEERRQITATFDRYTEGLALAIAPCSRDTPVDSPTQPSAEKIINNDGAINSVICSKSNLGKVASADNVTMVHSGICATASSQIWQGKQTYLSTAVIDAVNTYATGQQGSDTQAHMQTGTSPTEMKETKSDSYIRNDQNIISKEELTDCLQKIENNLPHLTKTEEKPYVCSICDYKCRMKSNLKRHIQTHTGEKPFTCNMCDHKFTRKSSLVYHMIAHTKQKPFACNMCDRKFTKESSLVHHMRIHTRKNVFACNMCDRKFTRKDGLVYHIRTHTGEKPFACNMCESKFISKSNLKIHTTIHTGEKPFACNLCSFRCTQKRYLNRHLRKHNTNTNVIEKNL